MSPYRTPAARKPEPVPTILRRLFVNLARLGADGICDHILSEYRWYRRARGGHWEFWTVFGNGYWFQRVHNSEGFGTNQDCEDYP